MDQSSPLVFCGLSPRRNLISQSGSQVSAKPLCCCTKEESTVSPGVVYHTDVRVSSFSVIRIWFINVLLFLLKSCVFILLYVPQLLRYTDFLLLILLYQYLKKNKHRSFIYFSTADVTITFNQISKSGAARDSDFS